MQNLLFSLGVFLAGLSMCEQNAAGEKSGPKGPVFVASAGDSLPFDLSEPMHSIFFESGDLKEISGLSATDQPGVFACVQDEKGVIYFVDATGGGAVLRQIKFRDKGDFEGVEIVGDMAYALKSDGDIFEFQFKKTGETAEAVKFKTPLETCDVEGLGHDPARNALLLACKGNPDSATLRPIFAFDLKTKKMASAPVYQIDPREVDRLLGKSDSPESDGKTRFFAPSAIAVQPGTGDVFVLSSVKKTLVVLAGDSGKIKSVFKLSKKMLPQPEGLCFDPEGNLYIGSEGKSGVGLLLKFGKKR